MVNGHLGETSTSPLEHKGRCPRRPRCATIPHMNAKQIIVMRRSYPSGVKLRRGKEIAQGAHASQLATQRACEMNTAAYQQWIRGADRQGLRLRRDRGRTPGRRRKGPCGGPAPRPHHRRRAHRVPRRADPHRARHRAGLRGRTRAGHGGICHYTNRLDLRSGGGLIPPSLKGV